MSSLLTVVISTFNRPEMLRVALGSVVDQSSKPAAIIVANDGDDNIGDVILQFENQISLTCLDIEHGGGGVAKARNSAIAHVLTPYVSIMDDDDIMLPNRIEDETRICRQGIDVAHGGWINFIKETRELNFVSGKNFDLIDFFNTGAILTNGACAVRTELLKQQGYEEGLSRGEDFRLFASLAVGGASFGHTNSYTLLRRIHFNRIDEDFRASQNEARNEISASFLEGISKQELLRRRRKTRSGKKMIVPDMEDIKCLLPQFELKYLRIHANRRWSRFIPFAKVLIGRNLTVRLIKNDNTGAELKLLIAATPEHSIKQLIDLALKYHFRFDVVDNAEDSSQLLKLVSSLSDNKCIVMECMSIAEAVYLFAGNDKNRMIWNMYGNELHYEVDNDAKLKKLPPPLIEFLSSLPSHRTKCVNFCQQIETDNHRSVVAEGQFSQKLRVFKSRIFSA